MKKLKRAYKIEINPTDDQKSKIHQTIGVSRFIYNFYIAHNKEIYDREGKFVSGMDFSKWLNNEYIPNNKDMKWIKEVSSKVLSKYFPRGPSDSFFPHIAAKPCTEGLLSIFIVYFPILCAIKFPP